MGGSDYIYLIVDHPSLGSFYVSTTRQDRDGGRPSKVDIRTDGKPWIDYYDDKDFVLSQDQIDWVNSHKDELANFNYSSKSFDRIYESKSSSCHKSSKKRVNESDLSYNGTTYEYDPSLMDKVSKVMDRVDLIADYDQEEYYGHPGTVLLTFDRRDDLIEAENELYKYFNYDKDTRNGTIVIIGDKSRTESKTSRKSSKKLSEGREKERAEALSISKLITRNLKHLNKQVELISSPGYYPHVRIYDQASGEVCGTVILYYTTDEKHITYESLRRFGGPDQEVVDICKEIASDFGWDYKEAVLLRR